MFEGNDEDIAEFLDIYECCADDAQLLKTEWVKIMFRYLDRSQRLTFKAFDGYAKEDWEVFSASIRGFWRGLSDEEVYMYHIRLFHSHICH